MGSDCQWGIGDGRVADGLVDRPVGRSGQMTVLFVGVRLHGGLLGTGFPRWHMGFGGIEEKDTHAMICLSSAFIQEIVA